MQQAIKIGDLLKRLEGGKSQNYQRCGRGFHDVGAGNATRVDPKKYRDTDGDADKYCTACFYEYNAGFHGKDYDY